jgi:hypothetical protein
VGRFDNYLNRTNQKTHLRFLIVIIILIFFSCTKQVGINPELAYSDKALFDSAQNKSFYFYQNKDTLLNPKGNSPHGSFKLRFNSVAYSALTAGGKLPVSGKFPEGSFIVKDIFKSGELNLYAWMYKRKNGWLWGEADINGKILYSQAQPQVCISCHNQQGQRDQTLTFTFH